MEQKAYDSSRYIVPMTYEYEEDFERDRRLFTGALKETKKFHLIYKDETTKDFYLPAGMKSLRWAWELRLEQLNEQDTKVYAYLNTEKVINGIAIYMKDRKIWDTLPSMVVRYAPRRIYAIWFTDDTPAQGIRQLQNGLLKKYPTGNLFSLLFVPGFYCQGYLSKVIHYSGEIFSFKELTEAFPPPAINGKQGGF